jgi:tetratricopeptide (TPR) repeat protein
VVEKLDELRTKLNDDQSINFYLDKIEKEKSQNQKLESEIRKPLEEDLDNLAETISRAKLPPVDENSNNKKAEDYSPKGKQFISETLAEIYLSQSNFKEALDIYEKLLESNPNKTEHYEAKISEIKNQMNN